MKKRMRFAAVVVIFFLGNTSRAEILVAAGQSPFNSGFAIGAIPAPANNDAATRARLSLVDGTRDSGGGELAVLQDGLVPTGDDQPGRNFFFQAGTDGGRVKVDLGRAIAIRQVCSYSWHSGPRAPQVYKLYASAGTGDGFDPEPLQGVDPVAKGWTLVARVDTRSGGMKTQWEGQHAVSITDSTGKIGTCRFLLFDILRTENEDKNGNTFYSELDVLEVGGPVPSSLVEKPVLIRFGAGNSKFQFVVDAAEAPDLLEWSEKILKPVAVEWYPQIVAMLPSDGYKAPAQVAIRLRNHLGDIPAYASGAVVHLNAPWLRRQLAIEAGGVLVHELVHVVQNYPGPRENPGVAQVPGWLVEGIADYIRWFHFEPQSRGAEITREAQIRYDLGYRMTANFLAWVTGNYDREIVRKLNAAAREGRNTEKLWSESAGKTVQELGAEWKRYHESRQRGEK